jgi:hypothetical protein
MLLELSWTLKKADSISYLKSFMGYCQVFSLGLIVCKLRLLQCDFETIHNWLETVESAEEVKSSIS